MEMTAAQPSLLAFDVPLPQSPTIQLREWTLDDLSVVQSACADPDIHRFTSMPDPSYAQAWLEEQPEQRAAGAALRLAIVDTSSQRIVGNIAFIGFEWKHARGEIGYWTLPTARGHGIAGQSLTLFTDWAFKALPLERIDLFTSTDNVGSKKVADAAGYQFEGTLRSFSVYRGVRLDLDLYARLRTDIV